MLLASLQGCVRTSIYVLDQEELIRTKAGTSIITPDGHTTVLKTDGWNLSDRAVDRVMNADVDKTNLK